VQPEVAGTRVGTRKGQYAGVATEGNMALTFSVVDTWDDGKRIHVSGTVAATGNYTTSGDTLDLSQVPVIASDQPPVQGTGWLDGLVGYDYVFYPGATMNANKQEVFQQGTAVGAFPELAAGAYPTAITGDTITFYGIFKKLQYVSRTGSWFAVANTAA